jgi:hypothetical protein
VTPLALLVAWIFFVLKIFKTQSRRIGYIRDVATPLITSWAGVGRLNNPFTRRSVHCGLQEWAEDDKKNNPNKP